MYRVNLHNWIAELPADIAEEVTKSCIVRKLTDGECLYRLGDPPSDCFQVLKGRVKLATFNSSGQEMLHAYLFTGDCTGDWGVIIDQPRMNSAIACGSAEVLALSKNKFWDLYHRYIEIPKALNLVMARRLRYSLMLAEDASLLPLRQRIARAVIRMVYTVGNIDENGRAVIEHMSHDELGTLVGSPRQSVGRELKKIEQEGAISLSYGKLVVNDIDHFCSQYDRLLSVEPLVPDYDK